MRRLIPLAMLAATGRCAVRLVTIAQDGQQSSTVIQDCQTLAAGVTLCNDLEVPGVTGTVTLTVHNTHTPPTCPEKVTKTSMLMMHYSARVIEATGQPSYLFETVKDYTRGQPMRLGTSQSLKGLDLALEGMCEAQKAVLTIPPELGFGKEAKPNVPAGSTLRYEVEIVKILKIGRDGKPIRPNIFKLIDLDGSQHLERHELSAHFDRISQPLPPNVLNEDKDGDGKLSWDEFGGPKGNSKDEL